MPDKQPITIQRGSFTCTVYEIGNLRELPLANLHKLWKIMFSTARENEATIDTIRAWLPTNIKDAENCICTQQDTFQQATQEAENLRSTVAAFGSLATKEQKTAVIVAGRKHETAEKAVKAAKADHAKAEKLQAIFTDMSKKAKI